MESSGPLKVQEGIEREKRESRVRKTESDVASFADG